MSATVRSQKHCAFGHSRNRIKCTNLHTIKIQALFLYFNSFCFFIVHCTIPPFYRIFKIFHCTSELVYTIVNFLSDYASNRIKAKALQYQVHWSRAHFVYASDCGTKQKTGSIINQSMEVRVSIHYWHISFTLVFFYYPSSFPLPLSLSLGERERELPVYVSNKRLPHRVIREHLTIVALDFRLRRTEKSWLNNYGLTNSTNRSVINTFYLLSNISQTFYRWHVHRSLPLSRSISCTFMLMLLHQSDVELLT